MRIFVETSDDVRADIVSILGSLQTEIKLRVFGQEGFRYVKGKELCLN